VEVAAMQDYRQPRRYHPAGTPLRSRLAGRPRQRTQPDAVRLRGGNLVRSLTPRQAVVWLMNFDRVTDRLPDALQPHFTRKARRRLARALRARVATREGFTRRKR
jgi:hypothetical protein